MKTPKPQHRDRAQPSSSPRNHNTPKLLREIGFVSSKRSHPSSHPKLGSFFQLPSDPARRPARAAAKEPAAAKPAHAACARSAAHAPRSTPPFPNTPQLLREIGFVPPEPSQPASHPTLGSFLQFPAVPTRRPLLAGPNQPAAAKPAHAPCARSAAHAPRSTPRGAVRRARPRSRPRSPFILHSSPTPYTGNSKCRA